MASDLPLLFPGKGSAIASFTVLTLRTKLITNFNGSTDQLQFYGRRPIYVYSYIFFLIWIIPCAVSKNIATMLVSRFFDGLAGSAFLSVAGGTVGDMFAKHELSLPMMVYTASPFIGYDNLFPFLTLPTLVSRCLKCKQARSCEWHQRAAITKRRQMICCLHSSLSALHDPHSPTAQPYAHHKTPLSHLFYPKEEIAVNGALFQKRGVHCICYTLQGQHSPTKIVREAPWNFNTSHRYTLGVCTYPRTLPLLQARGTWRLVGEATEQGLCLFIFNGQGHGSCDLA
jgi:hypothetical protein